MKKALLKLFYFIAIPLVIIYLFFINTFYIHPIDIECEFVDNNFNNNNDNASIFVGPHILAANKKLYVGFSKEVFFRAGEYEISNYITRRIYNEGFSVSATGLWVNNTYDNKLLYEYIDNNCIKYYNVEKGDYETLLKIKLPKDKPKSYFVSNNNLYIESKNKNIFRYNRKGAFELVASEKLCHSSYRPIWYYNNYMYYINDKKSFDRLYKYDFNTKKIVSSINISFFNSYSDIKFLLGTENKVFVSLPSKGKDNIYMFDLKANKKDCIAKLKNDVYLINGYGDNVYLSIKNKGVYHIESDNSLKSIYNKSVDTISILDTKWVYFYKNGDWIRITKDGKTIEKVFG